MISYFQQWFSKMVLIWLKKLLIGLKSVLSHLDTIFCSIIMEPRVGWSLPKIKIRVVWSLPKNKSLQYFVSKLFSFSSFRRLGMFSGSKNHENGTKNERCASLFIFWDFLFGWILARFGNHFCFWLALATKRFHEFGSLLRMLKASC